MTDEANFYPRIGHEFARHDMVTHSKGEYARGDVTTNTVEGYFSVFKRGMRGAYQHCKEQDLHPYLSEFDFRYSNRQAFHVDDVAPTEAAIRAHLSNNSWQSRSVMAKAKKKDTDQFQRFKEAEKSSAQTKATKRLSALDEGCPTKTRY